MTGGLAGGWGDKDKSSGESKDTSEDLDEIKKQLADLQAKLSKLG